MNKETKDLYYKMGDIKGKYNFYITGRDTAKQERIKEFRNKTAKERLIPGKAEIKEYEE